MTPDLAAPVREQPSRARSAKGKQVAARGLASRSRSPARSSYEKLGCGGGAGPVAEQPGHQLALREAQASRAVLRLGARSAPPVRSGYGKETAWMVLLSRHRVNCSSARGKQVAALRHSACPALLGRFGYGKVGPIRS